MKIEKAVMTETKVLKTAERKPEKKRACKKPAVSRLAILGAAICCLALLLSGCQNSAQTQEEIVVPRQEEGQEAGQAPGSGETDGQQGAAEEAVEGAIAEQIKAPERYSWEGGDEMVSVKVDAPLVVPQGEGFKTWKVTGRVFNQEDYDKVSQTLLGGAGLWMRDEKLMEASHGFTAAELEARIAKLEARKAEYVARGYEGKIIDEESAKGRTYDEEIEELVKLKENAPDEISVVDVPALVSYTEGSEYLEENTIFGTATVDGRDFMVYLDNNLRDDWRWISFEVRSDGTGNFLNIADEEHIASAGLSREKIRGMAEEAVAAMGFSDFAATGEEYFSSFSAHEFSPTQEAIVDQVGYGIYFTRELEGIPVTYTHAMGTTMEDGMDTSWPYETLCLIYTEDGFASFQWMDPYQVEKESDEYVFLLPWSEIQGIFEEMMVKKYSDFFGDDAQIQVDFDIDEVRLGYMRVVEKGTVTEGRMVPVWDFLGSETIHYPGQEEPYVIGGPYESWFTINAMDGTIIDRGLGY